MIHCDAIKGKITPEYDPKLPGVIEYQQLEPLDQKKKTNELLNVINHQPDIGKIFCMLRIHMKQNINLSEKR